MTVRGFARDPAPGVLTFFVAEAVSCILVESGFPCALGRVDEQRQRVGRRLTRVGGVGSHRNGRVPLYVDGGLSERRVRQDVGRPLEALAAVEMEPGAFGQVHVAVLDTGTGYGGHEEGVAEEELVVGRVGGLVFGVLEEEGA